jgi:hypothetical protein
MKRIGRMKKLHEVSEVMKIGEVEGGVESGE